MHDPVKAVEAMLNQLFADQCLDSGEPITRVLVAYSGGLDSRVMLELAATAKRTSASPMSLQAIHVHHGLHPAADRWAEHCQAVCDQLNIELDIVRVNVDRTGSIEQNARQARYEAFAGLLGSGDVLLLAHHEDDQIETGLFRLFRGHRLTGMPVRRELASAVLLRPLLSCRREILQAWADAGELTWVEDSSNASLGHDRNFLRHQIIPMLTARWTGLRQVLVNTLSDEAEHHALLSEVAEQDFNRLHIKSLQPLKVINFDKFVSLSQPRLNNLLRYWCLAENFPIPGRRLLTELTRQILHKQSVRLAWNGVVLERYQDWLFLYQKITPDMSSISGSMSNESVMGKGLLLESSQLNTKIRRGGERIADQPDMTHSVSQVLQESRVPPWLRDVLPLIYYEDEVVAIPALPQFGFQGLSDYRFRAGNEEVGLTIIWTFR